MQNNYGKEIEKLVDFGLANNSSILFLGPELVRFDGQDYNLAFYNSLPENLGEKYVDKHKAKYNVEEKIWSFSSMAIRRECYSEMAVFFKKKRNINDSLFHKLASIPFHLIISLIPDDTISEAFKQYTNFNFSFKSSLDSNINEPTRDEMLIYNIYGNICNNDYVASHFDYLNFIIKYADKKISNKLISTIKKANHLIFVGFEFDKWYNILLLYILNLIKDGVTKYVVEKQSADELYKKLLDNNLNVLFIEENGEHFITNLYQKAKDKGILRNIMPQKGYLQNMIKSNQQTIEKIKKRLDLTRDPMEERRLKLDIHELEVENETFLNQLNLLA